MSSFRLSSILTFRLGKFRSRTFSRLHIQSIFVCRIIRIEFNHSLIDYYTGIDGVLLTGIRCNFLVERPLTEQAVKGIIQKKLEIAQFVPQKTPSEAIEDFLKNDLNKFIEHVGLGSHPKDYELGMNPTIERIMNLEKVINDVPYEVLFNIMSFLDLKSLFQCSQVCKSFRNLINDPLLYIEVNLKLHWHQVNSSLMETLTPRCNLIKKLDLSSCGYFESVKSNDFINFIEANGNSLTNLRLNSSQFMNTSCLEIIGSTCSNLVELTIRNYMLVTTDRDFKSLEKLKKLEILDLSRSGVDSLSLMTIVMNNPNLLHLRVAFASQLVAMDEVCMQLCVYNRRLKSVDMWKCHNLTNAGIRALSDCFALEEIDVGWCLREEGSITESFKALVRNCKGLKKLILAAIRGISERDLENIALYCENLEHLDLMGIVGVSSENCKRIIDNCGKLKLLDISFCENLDENLIMIWRNDYNVCIKRSEVPNDG